MQANMQLKAVREKLRGMENDYKTEVGECSAGGEENQKSVTHLMTQSHGNKETDEFTTEPAASHECIEHSNAEKEVICQSQQRTDVMDNLQFVISEESMDFSSMLQLSDEIKSAFCVITDLQEDKSEKIMAEGLNDEGIFAPELYDHEVETPEDFQSVLSSDIMDFSSKMNIYEEIYSNKYEIGEFQEFDVIDLSVSDDQDCQPQVNHSPKETEKERRRKDSHNRVERQRRYNINDRIKELASLLPHTETNKGSILKATIVYIKSLKRDQKLLKQMQKQYKQSLDALRRQTLLTRILQLELKLKFLITEKVTPLEKNSHPILADFYNFMEAIVCKNTGDLGDQYEGLPKSWSPSKGIQCRCRQNGSCSRQTKPNDRRKQRLSTRRNVKTEKPNVGAELQVRDFEICNTKTAKQSKTNQTMGQNKVQKDEKWDTFIEHINTNIQNEHLNMSCKENGCCRDVNANNSTIKSEQNQKLENLLCRPCSDESNVRIPQM